MSSTNSFGVRSTLAVDGQQFEIWRLGVLDGIGNTARLPFSLRILLENLLRNEDGQTVSAADVEALANWNPEAEPTREIAFRPARVLLQDFTGVPAVVDLAAMREAIARLGGDPKQINPLEPADLVIDHSVQVDSFGSPEAFRINAELEHERNRERYAFLRWGQKSFRNFRVVPPDTGIIHQVNLEYLASVVCVKRNGATVAYPDSLVGTDSHTTMINGLGVLGWGVGGIEAEAAMLGQPISMLIPQVIGFRLHGELPVGATATDLVLTVTQMLRAKGVVGKFVEFFGTGLSSLSLPDRATLANMGPEYGATMGFFPVDAETLNFLRVTGRPEELVRLVEAYTREQRLFRTDATPDPLYTDILELDLATVVPSLAGPKRPQDRVPLSVAKESFLKVLPDLVGSTDSERLNKSVTVGTNGASYELKHGSVVIASITSCTNTSNPSVMIGAGLLAKKAVERGLETKPWVKTSLAPGSKVVTEYLNETGLTPYLDKLRFHLVGYGCATCIGNSGPLPEEVAGAVEQGSLTVASVLSGNRNFEGRINPHCRANYLASPPLVVAYALAGRMDIDLDREPLGTDRDGQPVYLREIWPTQAEVRAAVGMVSAEMYQKAYGEGLGGDEQWNALDVPEGETFAWDADSTYIKNPPFFDGMTPEPSAPADIAGARVLALLGDSVTTDHISPAGSIPKDSPAARYLIEHGVERKDFNSFGSRRGNHEVMMRGTFGNIRLKNLLAPGTEGGWTVHLTDGEQMSIYDAAMRYAEEGTPLVVVAGKEYGTGSSRDWAAKGTYLLGVRAVIAQSFERIHRSNLVGMGVLPLQFLDSADRASLGLTGREVFTITGIAAGLKPMQELTVRTEDETGVKTFQVRCRIDTPDEVEYYRHGGILQYVLRQLLRA